MKALKLKTNRSHPTSGFSSGSTPIVELSPFIAQYGTLMINFEIPYGRGTSQFNAQVEVDEFFEWITDNVVPNAKLPDETLIKLARACLDAYSSRRLNKDDNM